MAWTQQDYDTLKAAVASGVLEVEYTGGASGNRRVRYQDLNQMRSLLGEMRAEITPAPSRSGGRYIATSKGL